MAAAQFEERLCVACASPLPSQCLCESCQDAVAASDLLSLSREEQEDIKDEKSDGELRQEGLLTPTPESASSLLTTVRTSTLLTPEASLPSLSSGLTPSSSPPSSSTTSPMAMTFGRPCMGDTSLLHRELGFSSSRRATTQLQSSRASWRRPPQHSRDYTSPKFRHSPGQYRRPRAQAGPRRFPSRRW